mgnify:CR=1 FL=1
MNVVLQKNDCKIGGMVMKKILALLLAMMMILSFAACDKKSDSDDDGGDSASNVPSNVSQAIEDYCEYCGYSVGSLKVEYEWSGDITTDYDETHHEDVYLVSGKITDVEDEDEEDYKGGYVIFTVHMVDGGEPECYAIGEYEKSEKEFFEDTLEFRIEEYSDMYKNYQADW